MKTEKGSCYDDLYDPTLCAIPAIVKECQCPGCVGIGSNCFDNNGPGIQCDQHTPGTMISRIGQIFLGMPKGFNRLGPDGSLKMKIYESQKSQEENFSYDKYNIPVWKYHLKGQPVSDNELTDLVFVRGLSPRINCPFLHIIVNGDIEKINCYEVTEEDIENMD
jgi:hypothetical protein